MTQKFMIAALGLAVIASPAVGRTNAEQKAKQTSSADQKKYCIAYDNVVGSRVTRTECKTKADWAKERVDVDKLMKE